MRESLLKMESAGGSRTSKKQNTQKLISMYFNLPTSSLHDHLSPEPRKVEAYDADHSRQPSPANIKVAPRTRKNA